MGQSTSRRIKRGMDAHRRLLAEVSPPRLFSGWGVAAALAFMTSASISGSYTFGLALRPIGEQFGFDRASLALAVTLYTFTAGLLQPVAGYLADRIGSRQLGVAGVATIGVG